MNWFISNWDNILFVVLVALIVVYGLMTGKVKSWLEYAVTVAEYDLGSGTGQLKLRKVYDMFISQFPVFSKIVPFYLFSLWVDDALKWLKKAVENNENIKKVVSGDK